MTDLTMPMPAPAIVPDSKVTFMPNRDRDQPNKSHLDHKRLEQVADAILRLTHTEFKMMCAELHSTGTSIGSTPTAVEDCVFEYANRIMAEANNH